MLSWALVLLGGSAHAKIGVDENLGGQVPMDVAFVDEQGQKVTLADVVDGPTILTLVYYRCPSICNVLLAGVSDVLDRLELEAGPDYKVLTISFNPEEGPSVAREKKANYLKRMNKKIPEQAWRYLTGSAESIQAITQATGFHYEKQGPEYAHPATIMVLSPTGKITRYLYGVSFQPFDVKLALYEAAQGRTGPTIRKVLLFCFSYDPEGKQYAFNILKVTGSLTMVVLGLFAVILVMMGRRRRQQLAASNQSQGDQGKTNGNNG